MCIRDRHLVFPAAVPIDGDPLAAQLVGQQIHLAHIVAGGLLFEVDRFGDGVVRLVFLL